MQTLNPQMLVSLAAALGIGLMIGVERERRMGQKGRRGSAGVRTFSITSLLGALSLIIGDEFVLGGVALIVGALAAVAYFRAPPQDRGLTTEMALMTAYLLGALAVRQPELAGGLAVLVTAVLASRTQLHRFVSDILTEQELQDALLLAAAALVVLPLMPDRVVGPLNVLNPRTIWTLAVLVMVVNTAGYVALRVAGARIGLSLAGFVSGFISSAATVGAMGARAARNPQLLPGAVSGAVLSSVATVAEIALIVAVMDMHVLVELAASLILAGIAAVGHGAWFFWRGLHTPHSQHAPPGRPFDPRVAILFAATLTAIMFLSAAISQWLGPQGRLLAAAVGGFGDAHAVAGTFGSLARSGTIGPEDALLPILLGFSTNAVTKCVVAWLTGGRSFALRVIPGQILIVTGIWAGWLISVAG